MFCDCGHETKSDGFATGYGRWTGPDGMVRTACYDCCSVADAWMLQETKPGDSCPFPLYLVRYAASSIWENHMGRQYKGRQYEAGNPYQSYLANWPGTVLAKVSATKNGFVFGHRIVRFWALDLHGAWWYGTSPGYGMYVRMRKSKERAKPSGKSK